MYVTELSEPQLLVIYPGRFQPFHKGHHAVYEFLTTKFGRNNVYIATSNKVEEPKSPFTFSEKSYFMQLTGIPSDRIIQAAQPYKIEDVIASGNLNVADPANTVAIFAVSEKDMAEDPRFKSFTKKDGTPAYFQPMPVKMQETEGMNRHAYIMTVPTFQFNVNGDPMQSATELRVEYKVADEKTRQKIVADLFGKYTQEAEQIMNNKLVPKAPVAPPQPAKPTVAKPAGGLVKENGVGVVKNGNDPRYVMSTAGDQNDVDGNTLNKEMRAYGLVGRASPAGQARQIAVRGGIGKGLKLSEVEKLYHSGQYLAEHLLKMSDEDLIWAYNKLK
jgi:cytidyltransferase-like protein